VDWALMALAVKEFLKSLPVILEMLMKLKTLWDQSVEVSKRREKMKELAGVLDAATKTKDTSELEAFFRSLINK
jgi:hypothetical protein